MTHIWHHARTVVKRRSTTQSSGYTRRCINRDELSWRSMMRGKCALIRLVRQQGGRWYCPRLCRRAPGAICHGQLASEGSEFRVIGSWAAAIRRDALTGSPTYGLPPIRSISSLREMPCRPANS
jgi:hypothetical protein